MASINLGSFFDNWFRKPPKPSSSSSSSSHNFAFINSSNLFSKNPNRNPKLSISSSSDNTQDPDPPPNYSEMLDQYFWECDHLPDHRHSPDIDRFLSEHPFFESKPDPSPEEIEENKLWWEDFNSSPVVEFLRRSEEITDSFNERQLKANERPHKSEDYGLWKKLPNVPGLDGRPMPRKAIKTDDEAEDKFWDFTKNFLFGMWGFRQRSYPPGRPIDVAQAIGYKQLEDQYYD